MPDYSSLAFDSLVYVCLVKYFKYMNPSLSRNGYPDADYLERLRMILHEKGVADA